MRPQAVLSRPLTLRAPVEVLEGRLILSHPHGADLTRALWLRPLEQYDVAVFDAVCHRVAADAQSEPVGMAAQREILFWLGIGADRQAGGDLAEERDAGAGAQQRQAWTATGPATLHDQFAFGLQGPQVLTQGGIADVEGASQCR